MAKPTLFTDEIWASILEWLEDGRPLIDWCRVDDSRPKDRTISEWAYKNPALKEQLDAAFDRGMDAIAQRARKTMRGKTDAEGGESTGDVQRDKAIADLDLKLMAKWSARYADRVTVQHGGTLRIGAAADMTDAELARIAAGSSEGTALPAPSTD